jgi:D-glycero-alpha-D-manno-heptose-7-phosphate kinase
MLLRDFKEVSRMIISRTPFRISFFGGGTDYPAWFHENGGAVLSTTIDKYCYISCRKLPPFFEYKHRIVYSKFEQVNETDEIFHPSVRETFKFMNVSDGLEIHHDGDLPARSGIGSSSSFTVGLLHALYALEGKMVSKRKLAIDAIHIEQEMIKENVGSQDQIIAAFGGLNKIEFSNEHHFEVSPVTISQARLQELENHLMLFFSGFTRIASKIAQDQVSRIKDKTQELKTMRSMVEEAITILNGNGDITDFGKLLHESWQLKKNLSNKVSNSHIDHVYDMACKAGAIGGKILGAGGGGFILFFVKPEDRERLKETLGFLLHVPFGFEASGSRIVYYSEESGDEV